MIQAILFDIGNVLLRYDFRIALNAMRLKSSTPVKDALKEAEPLIARYEIGEIDRDFFLNRIMQIFNFSGETEDLVRIWQEIFTPNQPMIDLAIEASARVPLHLISNTSDIHVEYFEATYDFFRVFSGKIYSYEAGLMKPDPAIYDLAIRSFGLDPASTLYIDDLRANADAGTAAGLVSYCYDIGDHGAFLDWYRGHTIGEA